MSDILLNSISLINGTSVGIFGIILSAAFCDIIWTRYKQLLMVGSMTGLLLLQGLVYFFVDAGTVRHLYPVITHIPLAVVLFLINQKRLWSIIAVFTAYLCCQLRRWIALLVVAVISGDSLVQEIAELVITVPLLLFLLRFVAPSVRSLSEYPVSMQYQFGLIPVLAYGFDYLTQIYTNLFSKGAPVVAEFMSFVCSAAYLVFVLRISTEQRIRRQLEQMQDNLNLQVAQAVREIEHLRESQQQASTYRHDLRHHMQYLLACMENNQNERAQEYIHEVCTEIEANKVIVYCENEAANLIFSAFAGRAEEQNIEMKIHAEIPRIIPVSETDLCVLLSNALENALHGCQKAMAEGIQGRIEVMIYEKNGKVFLQIMNSCIEDIVFDKGIPVADRPGHGIGVRSICALVDRYRGIYSFEMQDGWFMLRVSL